jgi:hypothetical protein
MAKGAETHDLGTESDGEDFGGVGPGCAVYHSIYDFEIRLWFEAKWGRKGEGLQ